MCKFAFGGDINRAFFYKYYISKLHFILTIATRIMNQNKLFCNVFRINIHTNSNHLEYFRKRITRSKPLLLGRTQPVIPPNLYVNEHNSLGSPGKTATNAFLHKKHNSVRSFCLSALKVILNDHPPLHFGRRTPERRTLVHSQGIYRYISYISNWMCFLRRYKCNLRPKKRRKQRGPQPK